MDYGIQATLSYLNLYLEDKKWKGTADLNSLKEGQDKKYTKMEENPTLEDQYDEYLIRLSVEKKN